MFVKLRYLIAFLLPAILATASDAAPRRIVSLNLCADQLLIALADRNQVAALSPFARDKAMSFAAKAAMDWPVSKGRAEEVLALKPDLIITTSFQKLGTLTALKVRPVATLELAPANHYAEILVQIRQMAKRIGHPARGERLIAQMNHALPPVARHGTRPVAAYYQRRGYLTGTGTLVDEIMDRAGLANLAERINRPVLSRLSLEELLAARPDYLIVEEATDRIDDQGSEMLHHPAIAAIPRLRLAEAMTVCGGPSYPAAVQALVRQLQVKSPASRTAR